MSIRYFCADFHLGMSDILKFDQRPFKSIEEHDEALLNSCKNTNEDDIIIHVGDLASFKSDRGNKGLDVKPMELIKQIPATFINIRGNHDIRNKVKNVCNSMRIHLGKKYPDVSVSHYPSYDARANGQFIEGDIHISGHTHGQWKHCLDLTHSVLNICVSVDVWEYKIVSEDTLIKYIDKILCMDKNKLNKIEILKTGRIRKT